MSYSPFLEIHVHLNALCEECIDGAIGDAIKEAFKVVVCSPSLPPWRRRVEKVTALQTAHRKDWGRLRETLEWIIALAKVTRTSDDCAMQVEKLCGTALRRVRQKLRVYKTRPKRQRNSLRKFFPRHLASKPRRDEP